jgi:predicted nucleic acid-binding protein
LQGFRDEISFRRARDLMESLPIVESPLASNVVQAAIDLYRTARARGLTIRSSVDCLIAACAIRNDLEVIHVDRDFRALARVSRLKEHRVRA